MESLSEAANSASYIRQNASSPWLAAHSAVSAARWACGWLFVSGKCRNTNLNRSPIAACTRLTIG